MRTKNPTPKRIIIAAQAKIDKPSHKDTRKAWPQTSRKGQCVGRVVLLQIVLCFIAMRCIYWRANSCQKFYAQESRNVFTQKVQCICHQGQCTGHEAKVGNKIVKKHSKKSENRLNINVCLQRCAGAHGV